MCKLRTTTRRTTTVEHVQMNATICNVESSLPDKPGLHISWVLWNRDLVVVYLYPMEYYID